MSSLTQESAGLLLSQNLENLLKDFPSQVEEKVVQGVSKCFGRGHPSPEANSTASIAVLLKVFAGQLKTDPSRRHFVVDRDSLVTDDAGWLSLASCSIENNPLQWSITTVRSLERSVYEHCYATDGWKIQHAAGPRGSAVVTQRGATNLKMIHQVFFSDMPKCVAATGNQLGILYPDQLIVRVLRTAPRSSLTQGLTRVLEQSDVPSNVFTLWVRHHETIADLPGMGSYRYPKVHEKRSVVELLTDIVDEEQDPSRPTSPVEQDFVQASQATLHRCRPQSQAKASSPVPQPVNFNFEQKPKAVEESIEENADSTSKGLVLPNFVHQVDKGAINAVQTTQGAVCSESPTKQVNAASESGSSSGICTDPSLQEMAHNESVRPASKNNAKAIDIHAEAKEPADAVGEETASGADDVVFTTPSKGKVSTEDSQMEDSKAISLLGSPEHPTPLTYDPMGLAVALSATKSPPVDERYDDLELLPSLSFDEGEQKSSSAEQSQKVSAETVSQYPQPSQVVLDKAGNNEEGKDVTAIANANPIVTGEVAEQQAMVGSPKTASMDQANAVSQIPTVSDVPPAVTQQSKSPSNRGTKKFHCVGCGTNKAKNCFSNNQLKKRNRRCVTCVRANCLGPSNT